MLSRVTLLRRAAAVSVLLLGGMHASAQQLTSSSPFLPPQNAGAAAPTQNAPLVFGGLFETPAGVQYRIVDPVKKTGVFVKLGERNTEFNVLAKSYDAARETLVVEQDGRPLTLEIRKAKIISSGPVAQVMVPQPQQQGNANMLPAVTQTVVPNPTPAEEQKRLEAVAQEVARRRALREQAGATLNGPVQPVAQPQMQQQRPAVERPAQPVPNNNGRAGAQGRR